MPHFNFFFLDVEKKLLHTGCYDGNSPLSLKFSQPDYKLSGDFFEMWSLKRENWKNGQEEAGDMWCKVCNILFWSFEDLKQHVNIKHLVSKIFWHHWQNTPKREDFSLKCYQCSENFATVKELSSTDIMMIQICLVKSAKNSIQDWIILKLEAVISSVTDTHQHSTGNLI
jgi:hypothetical protein